jgi:hypothetical protein
MRKFSVSIRSLDRIGQISSELIVDNLNVVLLFAKVLHWP